LLKKGDVVQASEKIYKAAEEAVKILAKEHTPDDKAEHNVSLTTQRSCEKDWRHTW